MCVFFISLMMKIHPIIIIITTIRVCVRFSVCAYVYFIDFFFWVVVFVFFFY